MRSPLEEGEIKREEPDQRAEQQPELPQQNYNYYYQDTYTIMGEFHQMKQEFTKMTDAFEKKTKEFKDLRELVQQIGKNQEKMWEESRKEAASNQAKLAAMQAQMSAIMKAVSDKPQQDQRGPAGLQLALVNTAPPAAQHPGYYQNPYNWHQAQQAHQQYYGRGGPMYHARHMPPPPRYGPY